MCSFYGLVLTEFNGDLETVARTVFVPTAFVQVTAEADSYLFFVRA